jgi:glutaredoxin 3
MADPLELYTAAGCPHCAAAREDLEWRGAGYVEYDVEQDSAARERLSRLTGGVLAVPAVVENGQLIMVGWMGRSCAVIARTPEGPDSSAPT